MAVDAIGLAQLQTAGLAATPEVDHLRNVMASPLAGCDPTAIANVLPIVMALDTYISQASYLAPLSAKFSIGLDGGESVSVRDRLNDIWLVAESADIFRLYLGVDRRTEVVTRDCVALVDAIARVYLDQIAQVSAQMSVQMSVQMSAQMSAQVQHRRSRKARLRDVIEAVGFDRFLVLVLEILANRPPTPNSGGAREERLARGKENSKLPILGALGRTALEITLPLGYIQTSELRSLDPILGDFNLSEIRSTPWQTFMIPNVSQSDRTALQIALQSIGLNPSQNHPARGIVACSGRSGCQSAHTHAKEHALALIQHFIGVDRSFPSIHISGCEKRCAQSNDGDITLIGRAIDGRECYELHERDRSDIPILHVEDALNAVHQNTLYQNVLHQTAVHQTAVHQTVCSPVLSPPC